MPAGTSVTLSVGTAGMPPLRFQWQTNNADVVGATNAALTVTVPGNYSAVATAPNGASVTSGVAQVIGSVLNGTFSDLSGLRDLGGSWYFGVPADWICTSFPTGNMYAVNSASGPTPPVCNPSSLLYLRQQVGTLLKASHVVLTFDAPNAFSQPSAVLGAAILDTALQPLATAHCVPGLGYRLVAPTVPRGTTLTLQFWADTGFPGLDNVSVSISQPGTVMTVR